MNDFEAALAEGFYQAIMDTSRGSERAHQDQNFVVGISSLGRCSERVRRMLANMPPDRPDDVLTAWIGTQLGAGMEAAYQAWRPGAIIQAEVTAELVCDTGTYRLPGHPDIIDPEWALVLDGKTAFGVGLAERLGADLQQQFQRNTYGYAAWSQGLLGDIALEDVRVGNVWMDRGGRDKHLHVEVVPFSHELLAQTITWLDDVVYAYRNGQEAAKEPPRTWCRAACPWWRKCRQWETDAEGKITDPELLEGARMIAEGKAMKTEGARLYDQGREALAGINGHTDTHTIRWVEVNAAEGRKGHHRLDFEEKI